MPRDYTEYDDEPQETYRSPLKPFLVALVVLLLLFAVIIVLLYMRLQTANTRAETLSQQLTTVQTQLDDLRAQQAAPTEAPTPEPVATPSPTPEPTPEPTATPEPTPEPTPTPAPLLRDTITEEMLGYVYRPANEFWYDEAKTATVIPFMLAVHYGPAQRGRHGRNARQAERLGAPAHRGRPLRLGRERASPRNDCRRCGDGGALRSCGCCRSGRAGRPRNGGALPHAGLYRGLQPRSQIKNLQNVPPLHRRRGTFFMLGETGGGIGSALFICFCPGRSRWQNS